MAQNSGGGGQPPGNGNKSWADILGSKLPPTWNKNILEVILEKDERGPFVISEVDCAKLLGKVGLDTVNHI